MAQSNGCSCTLWILRIADAWSQSSHFWFIYTAYKFSAKDFFHNYSNIGCGSFPRDQRSDASEEETVPGSCLPLVAVMKGGSNVALVVAVSKSFLNYYPGLGLELESGDLKKKK